LTCHSFSNTFPFDEKGRLKFLFLADPRVLPSNCKLAPTIVVQPLPDYPVPPNQMPTQEPGTAPADKRVPAAGSFLPIS